MHLPASSDDPSFPPSINRPSIPCISQNSQAFVLIKRKHTFNSAMPGHLDHWVKNTSVSTDRIVEISRGEYDILTLEIKENIRCHAVKNIVRMCLISVFVVVRECRRFRRLDCRESSGSLPANSTVKLPHFPLLQSPTHKHSVLTYTQTTAQALL